LGGSSVPIRFAVRAFVSEVANELRKVRLIIAGAIGFALVLGVGSFAVWRTKLAHRVDSKLQKVKSAGLPTSGHELDQWYAEPTNGQNAALSVNQAAELLSNYPDARSNEVGRINFTDRFQILTNGQTELLRGYVALNEAALAKLDCSVNPANSRYPIDLSIGVDTPMPHLGKIKLLARLAQLKILAGSSANDPAVDAACATKMVYLARTLENEPILISQLVRMAVLNMTVHSLEWRLNRSGFDQNGLAFLSQVLADAERSNLVARALVGERAMIIPYFRMSAAEALRISRSEDGERGPPQRMLTGKPAAPLRITGFFERDLDFFLGVMQTNIAVAELAPPRSLVAQTAFEEAGSAAARHHYMLSSMLLPGFTHAVTREAECLARIRCARVALAVERFRGSHGYLPEKLADLGSETLGVVTLDPFDGAPLKYKIIPKGFVVYSVDHDGHDDGGRERPQRRKAGDATTYDITFTVAR
jgi:hypothetical protein